MTLKAAQASRPSGAWQGHCRQTFRKNPPWAADLRAAKPPCPHLNADGTPLPGQISQGAVIVAVHLSGDAAAKWTGALGRFRHGDDGDVVRRRQNLHHQKIRWDQRQNATGQGENSGLHKCPTDMASAPFCSNKLHQKSGRTRFRSKPAICSGFFRAFGAGRIYRRQASC